MTKFIHRGKRLIDLGLLLHKKGMGSFVVYENEQKKMHYMVQTANGKRLDFPLPNFGMCDDELWYTSKKGTFSIKTIIQFAQYIFILGHLQW